MPQPLLTKVAGYAEQDTAVGFYRIIQPLRYLKRDKLIEEARCLPFSGDNSLSKFRFPDKDFMYVVDGAEVFHTTMLLSDEDILRVLNLRKHYGFKWIVDMDDNIYAVPRDNPATQKVLPWTPEIERCLQTADGLTVSVPMLKELYGQHNSHIYVQPNGLDFDIWDKLPKKKPHSSIRIGWRGAYGHKDDLEMILPVMEAIQRDFPQVQFVAFGYKPEIPCEWHDWVDCIAYPEKLASLNLDIAVVPLVDSSYNRCKSNINYLEQAALKTPIVYSPTENQKGLPGFPATSQYEWYDALSTLIQNPHKRKEIGKECYDYAKKHGNMHGSVSGLATYFKELPRRTDLEPE